MGKLMNTIKDTFNFYIEENKVMKKISKSDKLIRLLQIIKRNDNNFLYSFLINSLTKINIGKVNYNKNGAVIIDKYEDKKLTINFYPEIVGFDSVSVVFKDNGLENKKEIALEEDVLVLKEQSVGESWRLKAERRLRDDEVFYERVSRVKKQDDENYDHIINTSHIKDGIVRMNEYIERTREGMLYSQYNKYYSGVINEDRSDFIFNLIEKDKEDISYESFENFVNDSKCEIIDFKKLK